MTSPERPGNPRLPTDVPADRLAPLAIAARRPLTLFGAPAEMALIPARSYRAGVPSTARPSFAPCKAERILRDETLWTDGHLALTPNKFPFLREQLILWPTQPIRDPDLPMWMAAHRWVAAVDGVAMLNNIGAAASIPRAHIHLGKERGAFLPALRRRPCTLQLELPQGVTAQLADLPFCLLALSGDPQSRAEAVWRLAEQRFTTAWNVVVDAEVTWVMPRGRESVVGTVGAAGGVAFAAAVGAAEVWGRWCYADEGMWEGAKEAAAAVFERVITEVGVG